MRRQLGERLAMNSPIQGSAADIIKIAMIKVFRELREKGFRSKMILQVHDELIIDTYEEEKEAVMELLKRNMMEADELKVPLEVGMDSGQNWYEVK
jgi:DNA polymerase-1